jgi:NAD(P)-dependent dehydrogenase (short-subunit alcohol dehydrogenase family)
MNEFENRVILIAGAKGGLGTSVTRKFLAAGATVAGSSKSIRDSDFASPSFTAIPADLTAAGSARQVVDAAIGRFGKIDALVHVMGGFAGGQPIPETTDETWDLMMNLNLRAAFTVLRAVIPRMRHAGRGRIENMDAGITANTILPGAMNTEANRKASPNADPSKWVQTERVASIAAFLVSDAGAEITGAAIPVYGLEI